jgi:tetratricopeptide (TPR) repeat protein
MRAALFLCLLVLCPSGAHAKWLQATSTHFVVYANDSETNVRRFSDQLERFHSAMAVVLSRDLPAPSPSNRVTVFVVSNELEVKRLYGEGSQFVGGFYVPRAGGSLAIVPRVMSGPGKPDESMIVLLHEYAHHFLISSSSFPMPRWLSEGAAEFFSSANFGRDGSVSIGRPANHRANELLYAKDVKVADLLDPEAYEKRKSKSYDAFYGKSWLLYHYLMFDDARTGQSRRYLRAMIGGKSSREAALEAFGDLDTLERDLTRYQVRNSLSALDLAPSLLQVSPTEIRQLSAGEAAMMPVRIRSKRGVTEEQAKELVGQAREIAARYPADPAVLAALAEAEHDAENDHEAIAAADGALAIDPSQTNAYVQKGFALFRLAAEAEDENAAYRKARGPFIALNKLENDHPLPLIYYYKSFVEQGMEPSALAIQGLERAVELAPFDLGLRMTLAYQMLRSKRPADARSNLIPIAYNPHGGELAVTAQKMIAHLDENPEWDGNMNDLPQSPKPDAAENP